MTKKAQNNRPIKPVLPTRLGGTTATIFSSPDTTYELSNLKCSIEKLTTEFHELALRHNELTKEIAVQEEKKKSFYYKEKSSRLGWIIPVILTVILGAAPFFIEKKEKIEIVEPNPNSVDNPTVNINEYTHAKISLINRNNIYESSRTSYSYEYLLLLNICEYNFYFSEWDISVPEPNKLEIYELCNDETGLHSWCVVVGKVKPKEEKYFNEDRAFQVSDAVANELRFDRNEGIKIIKFRKLSNRQISSDIKKIRARSLIKKSKK